MITSWKSLIAASLLAAALGFATPSAAATFDGDWNVQITSSNAACTSGASVSIGINNGQVASNSATVTASGRVAEAGDINVTLASGMKRAVGSGASHEHVGIGHMARRPVLGHLDRAADVTRQRLSRASPNTPRRSHAPSR